MDRNKKEEEKCSTWNDDNRKTEYIEKKDTVQLSFSTHWRINKLLWVLTVIYTDDRDD